MERSQESFQAVSDFVCINRHLGVQNQRVQPFFGGSPKGALAGGKPFGFDRSRLVGL